MDGKVSKPERKHYELQEIYDFIRSNQYPIGMKDWGKRSNFKRAAKSFSITNGTFVKDNRVVIMDRNRQIEIVKDIHEGLGDSSTEKALASHYGSDATHDNKPIVFSGIQYLKM